MRFNIVLLDSGKNPPRRAQRGSDFTLAATLGGAIQAPW
jgi:hypothetical protein